MIRLSVCPGNEYDVKEQLEICSEWGIPYLELTEPAGDKSLSDLDPSSLRKTMLTSKVFVNMISVSTDGSLPDIGYIRELIRFGGRLGAEYINLNAIYGCEEGNKIAQIVEFANMHHVKTCIENASLNPPDPEERLNSFFTREGKDCLMIFNPLEFAKQRLHPFLNVFYHARFKNSIRFLRINDGFFCDDSPGYPGEGNAEIKELISALLARGFDGFYSFHSYSGLKLASHFLRIYKAFMEIMNTL